MTVVGVIAEYNPFHLGHLYHLKTIRKTLKPDGIMVIMSGNFVQRGEPSIFNKWARTEMALHGGADLVIELPVCFSTATAEIFAESAIRLLSQSTIVDTLSFGIEEYPPKELSYLGKLLAHEPNSLQTLIGTYFEKGMSFPLAREKAIIKYTLEQNLNLNLQLISKLLKRPNFILAVEYFKAINKIKAKFSVFPVIRKGMDYHDKDFSGRYPSATAIRYALSDQHIKTIDKLSSSLPRSSLHIIKKQIKNKQGPIFLRDFETLILYTLRRMSSSEIRNIFDVSEGLENRIKKAAQVSSDIKQLISNIKTKRYPETRIRRILIHILLNIPREIVNSRSPLYFRVLGFTQKGTAMLREIKQRTSLPIITKASDYKKLDQNAKIMFEKDLLSSDIYSLVYKDSALRKGGADFSQKVIYFCSDK